MKILHVTQGYFPAIGGTELLIQRVSEEMVRQFGDEVTVFTTNCYNGEAFFTPKARCLPIGWEERNGVRVRRFPVRSGISRLLRLPQVVAYRLGLPGNQYLRAFAQGPIISGLSKAIREYPADIIAASSFPLLHMFAALQGAEKTGRPCVFQGGLHPQDSWGFERPMIYQAIQRANRYIAYTGFEAQYVIERGASPSRVVTVGVGVDLESYEGISTDEAKKQLNLQNRSVVGFIGQISRPKGVETLLRAMRLVWKVFPETHLLIAGAETLFTAQLDKTISRFSGDEQRRIIRKYNFSNGEKPWLYSAVDVLAYPSGFESFGIAYLEAWACRKPVIGCRRGAVPWVIHAGHDGLLVEFQDSQLLADAIILLLSNRRWAEALGGAGYEKVRTRYNWPEIARCFRQVYQDALAGRDHSSQ
jgi:glycosyltransferase involved in cell wall biosynthesis